MFKLLKQRYFSNPLSFAFKPLQYYGNSARNFQIENLESLEVTTRDYQGSLIHLLSVFKEHQVNLSCIETRKLNYTHNAKYQNVLIKLTFDKLSEKKLDEFVTDLERRFDNVHRKTQAEVLSVPWFPRKLSDLEDLGSVLLDVKDEVNLDHPQFTDPEYRKRRDLIAQASTSHKIGNPIPIIDYTEKENETWRRIYRTLKEQHKGVLSKRFQRNLDRVEKELGFLHKIPQLKDIDEFLQAETGFKIKAVHGILNQREFLNALGHKIFCCTQYIRHHSTPEYTPEPDIVHEIVGHVPMFADKEVADISQEIGMLSCGVQNDQVARLGAIYWYTIEFGAHLENGVPKGYGAGIASSIGECQNFPNAKFEKLDPFIHADQAYPIQTVQPRYLYSESFEDSLQSIIRFGESLQKPFTAYYDERSSEIKSDRIIKTHFQNDDGGPKF